MAQSTSGFPRKGEGSFVTLTDGRLLFAFGAFNGTSDVSKSRIVTRTSSDNGASWSAEATLFENPTISLLHPALRRLANGNLGLAYSKLTDANNAVKVFRYSTNDGASWSAEIPISDGSYSYMTGAHDRLLRLSNGRLLNLVHEKLTVQGSGVPVKLATTVFLSDNNGQTWQKANATPLQVNQNPANAGEYGFYETTAVEEANGTVYMLGRTATGWLWQSRSTNYGSSWSTPVQSKLRNPLAPARLMKLPNGLLIVFRNCYTNLGQVQLGERWTLCSQTSGDGGVTWQNYRQIEYDVDTRWYDYPSIALVGTDIHLAYRSVNGGAVWNSIDVRYSKLPVSWFTGSLPYPY